MRLFLCVDCPGSISSLGTARLQTGQQTPLSPSEQASRLVHFSSVQGGVYALRKAHICAPPHLSGISPLLPLKQFVSRLFSLFRTVLFHTYTTNNTFSHHLAVRSHTCTPSLFWFSWYNRHGWLVYLSILLDKGCLWSVEELDTQPAGMQPRTSHHRSDARSVGRGSGWRSTLRGRDRAIANQTNIGIV